MQHGAGREAHPLDQPDDSTRSRVANQPEQPPTKPATSPMPPASGVFLNPDGSPAAEHESGPTPHVRGYEVIGRLGHGGMGVVWRAVQLSTKRPVALKMLGSGLFASPAARRRFDREVELTAKFEHPHIGRLYESGADQGVYFYAMELIEGLPLDQHVQQQKLPRDQILGLMKRVCEAVQHAHQRGVIHRDLKPSNILVTGDGTPKVLDFGLAKLLEADTRGEESMMVSRVGEVAGTPAYMSPEQAAGRPVDTRSDVYTLGVILYRLLTGKSPHDLSGSDFDILRRISDKEITRPRTAAAWLDRELEALLLKALAQRPDDRYASAGDLAADIDNYLNDEPLKAKRATATYFLWKRACKHRKPAAVLAIVLLIIAALVVYGYQREQRQKSRRESEEAQRQRTLRLISTAHALVDEATALGAGGRWDAAAQKYHQAHPQLVWLGLPTSGVTIGLWHSYQYAPPSLGQIPLQAHPRRPLPIDSELLVHWLPPASDATDSPATAAATAAVRCVEFSSEDQLAAAGTADGSLYLLDVKHQVAFRRFKFPAGINNIAFAPDGRRIAVAGSKGVAWLVDAAGAVTELRGHTAAVTSIAFAPDGRSLATGSDDRTIRTWELPLGAPRQSFPHFGGVPHDLMFLADGRLATAGPWAAAIQVCDVQTGQRLDKFTDASAEVFDLDVARDNRFAVGRAQNVLYVWRIDNLKSLTTQVCVNDRGQRGAGAAIVAGHRRAITGYANGSLKLWDLEFLKPLRTYTGHGSPVTCVAAAPSGNVALSGAEDGSLLLHALSDGYESRPLVANLDRQDGVPEQLPHLSFSPDGRLLLTRDRNGAWRVWDVATTRMLSTPKGTVAGWAGPAAVHAADLPAGLAAGSPLLTYGGDTAVFRSKDKASFIARVLDTGKEHTLANDAGGINDFQLMERQAIAACGDGSVRVLDVATGTLLHRLPGHPGGTTAVAFSEDGSRALSGGHDRMLRLWDLSAGGRLLAEWRAHEGTIDGLAFNTAAHLAVSGCSGEREVKIWDLRERRELHMYTPPRDVPLNIPYRIAMSPDGRWVASTGLGPAVTLWDLQAADQRRALRQTLAQRPGDWQMLAGWYAAAGVQDWAASLLQQERSAGATMDPLRLVHAWLRAGRDAEAEAEIAAALRQPSMDAPYLLALLGATRYDFTVESPSAEDLLNLASKEFSRLQFRAAEEHLRRAARLYPADHFSWYRLAPLQLFLGDRAEYDATVAAMLEQFGPTPPPAPRDDEHIAKVSLLASDTPPEALARASAMLQRAAAAAATAPAKFRPWLKFAQALRAYRAGDFAAAETLLTSEKWDVLSRADARASAEMLLAMTWRQLGKTADATDRMSQAVQIIQKQVLAPDVVGTDYEQWLICQILLREAHPLFPGMQWPANAPREGASAAATKPAGVERRPDRKTPGIPYQGRPMRVPGTVQAEHFDEGVEGAAYHDNKPDNTGKWFIRPGGVDLEAIQFGQVKVSSAEAGEWLAYTIEVEQAGTYDVAVKATSGKGGSYHLEIDGQDVTGQLQLQGDGSPPSLRLLRVNAVRLRQGKQVMMIAIDSGSVGIDAITFARPAPRDPSGSDQ